MQRLVQITLTASLWVCTAVEAQTIFGPEHSVTPHLGVTNLDLLVADISGDGELDIVYTKAAEISWVPHVGGLSFGAEQVVGVAAASAISAADLDGDGDIDVLSASQSANEFAWYENLGGGACAARVTLGQPNDGSGAQRLVPTDYDQDGDTDIACASGTAIYLLENLGGGSFGSLATAASIPAATGIVYDMRAADLDGDGDDDLVVASHTFDGLFAIENLGAGNFASPQALSSSRIVFGVHAEDMDADGDLDILGTCWWDDEVIWFENQGGASFLAAVVVDSEIWQARSVSAGDVDLDGLPDIVSGSSNQMYWWKNHGGGSFGQRQLIRQPSSGTREIHLADFDSDGDLDIIGGSYRVVRYRNMLFDCNGNGIPDDDDISSGFAQDCNTNGVPDSCDLYLIEDCDLNANGVLDACECAIENYCLAQGNSSGQIASMSASGLPSLVVNDLTLHASGTPAQKFGMFLYGRNENFVFYGDGALCVQAPIYRIAPLLVTSSSGTASLPLDLTALPFTGGPGEVSAGETWHFQLWFRDPAGGFAGFNFSDGLKVTFCP